MIVLDKYCQVRIGGLPYMCAQATVNDQLASSLNNVSTCFRFLNENRETISNLLFDWIGQNRGNEVAQAIVMRRSLYKRDFVSANKALRKIEPVKRDAILDALGDFGKALLALEKESHVIINIFPQYLQNERIRLLKYASDEWFMSGVAVAAPALLSPLKRLAKHVHTNQVDGKDRKAERSFLSYVLRAAAKTSPFSTLGPVSLCLLKPQDTMASLKSAQVAVITRITSPSIFPIAHILDYLLSQTTRLGALPLRVNSNVDNRSTGLFVDRTRWEFTATSGHNDYAKPVESHINIKQKELALAIAAMFDGKEVPLDKIVEQTSSTLHISLNRAYDLIGDLIRLGFLTIPSLVLHSRDGLRLEEALKVIDYIDANLGELMRLFIQKARSLSGVENADQRSTVIHDLRDLVGQMYEFTGIKAQLPRTPVYEDVLISPDSLIAGTVTPNGSISDDCWFDDVNNLEFTDIVHLLDIVDDSTIVQSLMIGYFKSIGRSKQPAYEFVTDFNDQLYDSFRNYDIDNVSDNDLSSDPWLQWGDAWRWVLARRKLSAWLGTSIHQVPVNEGISRQRTSEVVDIRDILHTVIGDLTLPRYKFRHFNLFVQRLENRRGYVVNRSFGGVGFAVSRFAYASHTGVREFTQDVEKLAAQHQVILAEISGGALHSNLNIHDPMFATALTIPSEQEKCIAEKNFDLRTLQVCYSQHENRLVLANDLNEIQPVYAGYLTPMATTISSQIVGLMAPPAQFMVDLTPRFASRPRHGTLSFVPRVTIGKLVISRAKVVIASADMPQVDPLQAAGYMEWVDFWNENALPQQCYIHIKAENRSNESKPWLFNLASILSCGELAHALKLAGKDRYMEMVETLPSYVDESKSDTLHISERIIGISVTEDQP